MADVIHAVLRTDDMAGTKNPSALRSVKYYDNSEPKEIENGMIVVLGDKEDREVFKATAPTANSTRGDLYLIAGVELFYDESKTHYLTEWVNEAGRAVRAYHLIPGQTYSVTKEALDGAPAVGQYVEAAAGQIKAKVAAARGALTIGKIVAKEVAGYGNGAYEYYMIETCEGKA